MCTSEIKVEVYDSHTYVLTRTCPECSVAHSIMVDREAYDCGVKVRNFGVLIQEAFPTFDTEEREFMLTGICDECWNKLNI